MTLEKTIKTLLFNEDRSLKGSWGEPFDVDGVPLTLSVQGVRADKWATRVVHYKVRLAVGSHYGKFENGKQSRASFKVGFGALTKEEQAKLIEKLCIKARELAVLKNEHDTAVTQKNDQTLETQFIFREFASSLDDTAQVFNTKAFYRGFNLEANDKTHVNLEAEYLTLNQARQVAALLLSFKKDPQC